MATLSSTLRIALKDGVTGPARGVSGALSRMRNQASSFGRSQRAMGAPIGASIRGLVGMAAAYVGVREGISGTIGAALSFEDKMSDIKKVVDFKSDTQFQTMSRDILDLSKRIPLLSTEIADITAAAGQANIPYDQLLTFTEMTAKVSTAWDIAAGSTGESLAGIRAALGLTIKETGLVADAINHLGNNTAANAPKILRFSRGLSAGKQAGFAAQETLAFGAAMISANFEAEVAETSFRKMAGTLSAGTGATSGQRKAMKKLGFDAKKLARNMQKDAVGTTLGVLDAINKLPKEEQGAISLALFGAEARALPALIGNTDELRRVLGLVADEVSYAGSSAREYEIASKRTSNTLKLLKNNLSAIGVGFGQLALPSMNSFASKLAETLLTLDQRVTVFDKMKEGIHGFMSGLGLEGDGLSQLFSDGWSAIFGDIATFEQDVNGLSQIFAQFQSMGENLRSFSDAFPMLGQLAGYGLGLALASVGFSMIAGSVMALGRAVAFLTGVTALIGGAKGIARILGALSGGGATKVVTGGAAGAATGAAGAGFFAGIAKWVKGLGLGGMIGSLPSLLDAPTADTFEGEVENQKRAREKLQELLGLDGGKADAGPDKFSSGAYLDELRSTIPSLAGRIEEEGSEATAKAESVGQEINELLSLTAKPEIDTTDIDRALAKTQSLSSALRNLPGSSAPLTSVPIAGARARGGPAAAGKTYLVGEDGAELFTPSSSGFVHDADRTASMMGGRSGAASAAGNKSVHLGGVTIQVIAQPGMDPQAIAQAVNEALGKIAGDALSGGQFDKEWSVA